MVIRDDDALDVASEQLDELRRRISRRVVECTRVGVKPEDDSTLIELRQRASALLSDISRYELVGPDSTI